MHLGSSVYLYQNFHNSFKRESESTRKHSQFNCDQTILSKQLKSISQLDSGQISSQQYAHSWVSYWQKVNSVPIQ
jgi:hypothetical protein